MTWLLVAFDKVDETEVSSSSGPSTNDNGHTPADNNNGVKLEVRQFGTDFWKFILLNYIQLPLNAGIFCLFWWNYVLFKQQSSSNETWGSGRFPSTASGDSSVWGGTTSGGSVWGNSNPTTPSTPGILGTFGHLASLYTFIFFYPAFPSFSLCIPFLFSNCNLQSPILSLPSARWTYLAYPFY